jgi:aspartate aminotransferase-like enzyme
MEDILLTPGPTKIPQRIFDAMERHTLHHRTKEFESIFSDVLSGLQSLLGSPTRPILLASSGTGAMEASVLNLSDAKTSMAFINGGVFGDRWGRIGKALSVTLHEFSVASGKLPEENKLFEFLKAHKPTIFCFQQCETSTGTSHPVKILAKICKEASPETIIIVDAISSLCTIELHLEQDGVDIIVGGSQKAFGLQPGLSFLAVSDRAWKQIESTPRRSLYFDLLTERKAHEQSTSAWTPAIGLILGMRESLKMINEETLPAVIQRHKEMAKKTSTLAQKLGFTLFSESPANSVTALTPPTGVTADAVIKKLYENHHVRIAEGQAALKGKILRIGHMGFLPPQDLEQGLQAFEGVVNSSREI